MKLCIRSIATICVVLITARSSSRRIGEETAGIECFVIDLP